MECKSHVWRGILRKSPRCMYIGWLTLSRKLDPKIAETTWVHRIFGGKLRSQVRCRDCGHKSDTFDSILDLSIDIHQVEGLRDALKKFTHIDVLKGADKYKCEKYVNVCFCVELVSDVRVQMQKTCRCREAIHNT